MNRAQRRAAARAERREYVELIRLACELRGLTTKEQADHVLAVRRILQIVRRAR